jgi:hypothetical protein
MALTYIFSEELWLYKGEGAWYFITLPIEYADEIKSIANPLKRGFGSIKVKVTIGKSTWNTSIFPDLKSKSYMLPIKKEIRIANKLRAGDTPKVEITLRDEFDG